MEQEAKVVPDYIRGYRIWELFPPSASYGPYLAAVHQNAMWPKDEPMTARCNDQPKLQDPHTPPSAQCTCGIYARFHSDELWDVTGMGPTNRMFVAGAIDAYGTIVMQERGFRAQYAKILGIAPFFTGKPIPESLLREVTHDYQILLLGHFGELELAFPTDHKRKTPQMLFEDMYANMYRNVDAWRATYLQYATLPTITAEQVRLLMNNIGV